MKTEDQTIINTRAGRCEARYRASGCKAKAAPYGVPALYKKGQVPCQVLLIELIY